jgi:elongator complex protein 3
MEAFYKELFEEIESQKLDSLEPVLKLRRELCRKHKPKIFPSIIDILSHANLEQFEKLKFLITKPMRTRSGVTPIALMTKPGKCPHGTCTMCPGGIGSPFGDMPQSYTGAEPSTMRAIRNFYDPYLMVFNRLEQFVLLNQSIDKTEVIVQGGTFPAMGPKYQESFVLYTFKAMNDFSELFFKGKTLDFDKFKTFFELPVEDFLADEERTKRIQEKVLAMKGESTLEEEKRKNETAKVRCVGLTIETKPDWGLLKHGNKMLEQGCTRVELGLQSVSDEVLKVTNRGHTIKDSKDSMRILRDLGFKINAHIMIGLPKQDHQEIYEFFSDPDYRPDMLKIYPCMVMPGTKLEQDFKDGKFKPTITEEAVPIIAEFLTKVPEYVRVMRIQRDIPTKQITAGVNKTNLRQMIDNYMKKNNMHCTDIRNNEIKNPITNPKMHVLEFEASGAKEFFISIKQEKEIIGFCRLRFPSESLREEITEDSGIVRELHVYGKAIDVSKVGNVQHKGFGTQLMKKAEEICKTHNKNKLVVIAGVGVREYYRNVLGYENDGPYVSKQLS